MHSNMQRVLYPNPRQPASCRLCVSGLVFLPGGGGGEGVPPYMGYIGMCGAKGYGFSAALVINRVSLLAILPPFW